MILERNKRIRFSEQDRKDRLAKLKTKTGLSLPSYQSCSIDSRSVAGHIENYIGTVSIPVGLVGPLEFHFNSQSKEIFAPIATTEGALVSSIQRGVLAIKLSGGVTTRHIDSRMIRAPQFTFANLDAALNFKNWIGLQQKNLNDILMVRSKHCRLTEIEAVLNGRTVHARFIFTTGNAAGQNMTTFATSFLCQQVFDQWRSQPDFSQTEAIIDFHIEGNLSSDKKVSHWAATSGRGRSVVAECLIKASVVKRVLKMDPKTFVDRFQLTKSAANHSGFLGYNINVANVVAALFAATGQDLACIHESSIADFNLVQDGENILATLHMPCLVLGTVGGGVALPGFRDNLSLLGCESGENSADQLAQIICGFSLALELSTVSAIGANSFVEAHERLGRQAKHESLDINDIGTTFFENTFNEYIKSIKKIKAENRQGYMTEMARQVSKNYSGMLAYEIETETKTKKAFLKVKASDREIVYGCARILEYINPGLAELVVRNRRWLPFQDSHLREIEVLSNALPSIQKIAPQFYGSFIDEKKEVYVLIQELLESHVTISDLNLSSVLAESDEMLLISNLLDVHKEFFNCEDIAKKLSTRLIDISQSDDMENQEELWYGLSLLVQKDIKSGYPELNDSISKGLEKFSEIIQDLGSLDKSLIHYDFNPRNVAFDASCKKFYLFDWEFAAWGPPQRDLIEWVIFTSDTKNVLSRLEKMIHVSYLHLYMNRDENLLKWTNGFQTCFYEFLIRRLPFYIVLSDLGMKINQDEFYGVLNELSKFFAKKR